MSAIRFGDRSIHRSFTSILRRTRGNVQDIFMAARPVLISQGSWQADSTNFPTHHFTNNSQSEISCALRISDDAGSSIGARGTLSSFRPASCGRRLPFLAFTSLLDHTRFSHASLPPRERGSTWSRLPSSGFSTLPVY